MKTIKMKKDDHTIECTELVKNVWERAGYKEVSKGGRPPKKD